METTLNVVEGMQFDRGYISPYFVTDSERMEAVLEDPFILICEKKISNMKDLIPTLEQIARAGKPLLIIAEDVDGEALATLVVNKLRGTLNACAVKAPGFGDRRKEMLKDIAILTGGQAVTDDLGPKLENLTVRIWAAPSASPSTRTTPRHRWRRQEGRHRRAVKQIRAQIEETTSDYDREKLQERLAKLVGGVAVIKGRRCDRDRDEGRRRASRTPCTPPARPSKKASLAAAWPFSARRRARRRSSSGMSSSSTAWRSSVAPSKSRCAGSPRTAASRAASWSTRSATARVVSATTPRPTSTKICWTPASSIPTKVVRTALQNAASVASLMLTTGFVSEACAGG